MIRPSLTMVRRIKASPARVFAAFVRPEYVTRWWGPDAGPVLSAELDVRVGGVYRVVFRNDAGETYDCRGTYQVVEPPMRLVYTMGWAEFPDRESLVTLTFTPIPEGTELMLLHERFHDEASRDNHAQGWWGALEKLQPLVEALPEDA